MAKIFVITEKVNELKGLISGAFAVGGERPAVVTFSSALADAAIAAGADVFLMGPGGDALWEYLDTIAALVEREQPAGCFFGLSQDCRLTAGRLAARLGITAFPDAKSIDENFAVSHLIYGGAAIQTNRSAGQQCIALFGPGQFDEKDFPPEGTVREVPFVEPKWRIRVTDRKEKEAVAVDLASAKRIVAVGLGLSKQEDLEMVRELADLLRAEVACTRPIAEGLGWMEPERYIGISANFVKPDLYLALGISGQVQHTVGITDSKVVVSINRDGECAMMKQYADYCAAADLYQVVPALIRQLKESKE